MSNLPREQWNSPKNSGMNLSDIAMLLGFIGIYDLRIQVDELKVRAWSQSLDTDIPLEEAKKIVSAHYSNSDTAINPSHINREWRHRLARESELERGRKISEEMEKAAANAAKPETVEKYLTEIRTILNRGNDASMENDSAEVASDQ